MNIKTKFSTPFPFVETVRDKVFLSLSFGGFIYVFLLLFQPFGIANISFYKPVFVLGYGAITFLIVLASFLLYPKISSDFDPDKWTVKKMFNYTFVQIISIALLNWIYTATVGRDIVEQYSLLMFLFMTFSVGVIPTSLFVLLLERYLNYRNKKEAGQLTDNFTEKLEHSQNIVINLGSQQDKLSLNLLDLLCIKSDGNYIEVYILEKDLVKKHLFRYPLSKIKQRLESYHQIIQCHRSYIVNTQHLVKISGNARNFNLHLNHLNFDIPVSRSFPINTLKSIKDPSHSPQ